MKNINKLLNDLIQYCYKKNNFELSIDDRPLYNLLGEIKKHLTYKKYFEVDIVISTIENFVESIKYSSKKVDNELVTKLIDLINKNLEINVEDHYIVIPVPKAKCSMLLKFDKYAIIPQDFTREEKIKEISKLVGVVYEEIESFAEHTEKSRSPSFYEYTLLCIKVNNQTSMVKFDAENISKYTIFTIRCLYYAYMVNKNNKLSFWSLIRDSKPKYPSTHIAIFSKESWRMGHHPINFFSNCNFNLDWLEESEYQKVMVDLIDTIINPENSDELSERFFNALLLMNKSYQLSNQSEELLSVLVSLSTAESLLTKGKNEKRLRLSAIIPRIVSREGYTIPQLSKIINQLYMKRNDFLHGGENIVQFYGNESDSKDRDTLILLQQLISKVICSYPTYTNYISGMLAKEGREIGNNNYQERSNRWDQIINDMFNKIITGEDNIIFEKINEVN
ncbi:hypothetical protein [Guptibacillus hwajinpoensis]|uniref:hypothetical protein n=1 Tax=Guptibacillus hwajinpoensis TaxID=208199 RepID=UPI0024B32810|nr:hypothetical protein [Pseudalkalibacillus hwajinpoensis]